MNNVLLFLVGLLIFILPTPHTISIRNISALLILISTAYLVRKYKYYKVNNELKRVYYILSILTIWILFVAFFISNETSWSLREINGQWITPLLYFISFVNLALYASNQNISFQKNLYTVVFLMFFVHILYIDLYAFKDYLEHKTILSRVAGLTNGSDKSNYLTNILLSFIVVEVIYRFRMKTQYLTINNLLLVLILILTITSSIFEGMRNGVVAIIFLGISGILFAFYQNNSLSKQIKIVISVTLLVSISIPAIYNLKHDNRWSSLIETIPIALDTQNNKAWIDRKKYSYPKLSNGQVVSPSNYERVAWFYEGAKLIAEHPLGIGFGRNAFGHGIRDKYNLDKQIGHSHSGFIDLGIGIGIPGLIIWTIFCLYLMYLSFIYFKRYNSYFAIILFFNITGFYSRFLVDSNMRDHMIETFFVIIGLSLIYMLNEKNEKNTLYTSK